MSEQRFAVLIGSGSYPDEPKLRDLRCPPRDVEGMAEVLRSRGSFASVAVVKDAPHHEALLQVNRTLKRAGKEDLVFIYYSGHGKLDIANRLYLCTPNTVVDALEATAVPVQSIRDYIDVASCYQVVLVLDCCFSGAVGDVFARSSVDDQLQLVSRGRGTYIMTASTAVQVAVEKEDEEYSAFTKHMVAGLESEAADVDQDGVITMDELYQYVHEQLRRDGFQEPMKWAINVRGELLIARTGKQPRSERRNRIRKKLIDLAAQGTIPDKVLSRALNVLATDPGELTPLQRSRDELLDRLDEDEVRLGEFVQEWLHLEWAESWSGHTGRAVDRPPSEPAEEVGDEPAPRPDGRAGVRPAREPAPPEAPGTSRGPGRARGEPEQPQRPAQPGQGRRDVEQPPEPAGGGLSLTALRRAAVEEKGAFWKLFGATVGGVIGGLVAVGVLGVLAGDALIDLLSPLGDDEAVVTLLVMTCCGAGVGLAQRWMALRERDVRWITATTIGWALGGGLLGGAMWDVAEHPVVFVTLAGLLGTVGAGLAQSMALRAVQGRGAWIRISALAPLVGLPFGVLGLAESYEMSAFLGITASVLAYAALTSAGLVAITAGGEMLEAGPSPSE